MYTICPYGFQDDFVDKEIFGQRQLRFTTNDPIHIAKFVVPEILRLFTDGGQACVDLCINISYDFYKKVFKNRD